MLIRAIERVSTNRFAVKMPRQLVSKSGFDVKINGKVVHHAQSFDDAAGEIYHRLLVMGITEMEITPATK